MSDRPIRVGGLMRCCIMSVYDYDGPEVPGETVIACTIEKRAEGDLREGATRVRLAADGAWEWDH